MPHKHVIPGPPLSRFVELLWYYENAPQPHQKERLMPDGCISLVINLFEDVTAHVINEDPIRPALDCHAPGVAEPVCPNFRTRTRNSAEWVVARYRVVAVGIAWKII